MTDENAVIVSLDDIYLPRCSKVIQTDVEQSVSLHNQIQTSLELKPLTNILYYITLYSTSTGTCVEYLLSLPNTSGLIHNKNSSKDEIANVNFYDDIARTYFKIQKKRTYFV